MILFLKTKNNQTSKLNNKSELGRNRKSIQSDNY